MIDDIVIVGAGGHAKEISFLIEEINNSKPTWNLLGYIEKDHTSIGKYNGKYRILNDESYFEKNKGNLNVVIALGSPHLVKSIHSRLKEICPNIKFPNLIHPSVRAESVDVKMGHGNIVCAGNIFTTDIKVGSFNCINRGCNISHDVEIHNYCIINPGVNISGGVMIKDKCLIGTGATILQYLTIGTDSIIGAGAVVTKDVTENVTVVGVPAKTSKLYISGGSS
jgi:sugar O-acyltransferase (sialic acid O-acetyltransferase NeuD family)